MQKPERSAYTPLDFITWREGKTLIITPKFQRRGVWTSAARSFFIDTLLQGMPVPPLYLRIRQSDDRKQIVRELVDGQQRISAVLDYLDDKYALSRALGAQYGGKKFSKLQPNDQDLIRSYSFICEVFHGISDKEVLEIFMRLNTYSVPLNAQELRNGRYFGYFKQTAYRLAHEHLEFWRRHRLVSERSIARMLEVELTSELMAAQLDGMQDKKKSIDKFYSQYDNEFKEQREVENQFRAVMDQIDTGSGDFLRESEFQRPPLFYTLFCVVYHRMFRLPSEKLHTPRRKLSNTEVQGLAHAISELSDVIAAGREGRPIADGHLDFVNACLRQTDNIQPRKVRFEKLYRAAF
jgi:hypothetical protein